MLSYSDTAPSQQTLTATILVSFPGKNSFAPVVNPPTPRCSGTTAAELFDLGRTDRQTAQVTVDSSSARVHPAGLATGPQAEGNRAQPHCVMVQCSNCHISKYTAQRKAAKPEYRLLGNHVLYTICGLGFFVRFFFVLFFLSRNNYIRKPAQDNILEHQGQPITKIDTYSKCDRRTTCLNNKYFRKAIIVYFNSLYNTTLSKCLLKLK